MSQPKSHVQNVILKSSENANPQFIIKEIYILLVSERVNS